MISCPAALWLACLLDLLLGDPRWLPHPVRLMGRLAAKVEGMARSLCGNGRTAGIVTAVLVLLVTGGTCFLLLALLFLLHPLACTAAAILMLYTSIAIRDLLHHAGAVYGALDDRAGTGGLDAAREKVAMLVGRDTDRLDESGIVRACVESVAENMADGIVAPIFWSFAGALLASGSGAEQWAVPAAAIGAMLYKAGNTMDSMFGYINEQYREFGWFPARFDDLLNLVPARLSALCIVMAALAAGSSPGRAWKILVRDRRNHTSPNAGFPEAAMAGALGIRLGGPSSYFGTLLSKPTLGDPVISPAPRHILQANRIVLIGSLCSLIFLSACYLLLAG